MGLRQAPDRVDVVEPDKPAKEMEELDQRVSEVHTNRIDPTGRCVRRGTPPLKCGFTTTPRRVRVRYPKASAKTTSTTPTACRGGMSLECVDVSCGAHLFEDVRPDGHAYLAEVGLAEQEHRHA